MRKLISLAKCVRSVNSTTVSIAPKRFSSHYVGYRELNYDPNRPKQKLVAEFLAGVMYWWIGWNLMTDWRHLIGEFIWPNFSDWTDEELGIPKD